jgi:2-dehydropantoate 2-reductase
MIAITDAMTGYEPSMQVDRDAGRPMELDAIYGRTLEAIHQAGGHAPRIETVLAQLRFIEVK